MFFPPATWGILVSLWVLWSIDHAPISDTWKVLLGIAVVASWPLLVLCL